MKTKILIAISLLLIYNKTFSQQDYKNDKKLEHYKKLIKKNQRLADSLNFHANELYIYSVAKNNKPGQLIALTALANSESRLGNIPKSNSYYYKALKLAKEEKNQRAYFGLFIGIANNHRFSKDYDSAFYYYKKLKKHFQETNNVAQINMIEQNLGITFFQKTELDSALIYFESAKAGFKKLNNQRFLALNLSLTAEVLLQKNKAIKAIVNAQESLEISKEINFNQNYSRNYNIIARAYELVNDSIKAQEYYHLEDKSKKELPKNTIKRKADANEDYYKSQGEHYQKKTNWYYKIISKLKNNLILATVIILLLTFGIILFLKKHKRIKNEFNLLEEELNSYKNKQKSKTPIESELIHLKSKAILDSNKILYIKSDGHYVEYYLNTKDKPEIDRNSLNQAYKLLPSSSFIRIHKSFIVNINRIKIINSTKVMLDNGVWINLSRTYKQQLKDILHKDD